jgi:transcriptional regulator with XRE-family HTH domain
MEQSEISVFAKNLANLRRKRRWTQRDLAERLLTNHSMVLRWEKSKAAPRADTLERLAAVFEVSVDELCSPTMGEVRGPVCDDSELSRLLALVPKFARRDQEALKAILEAIVTKNRLHEMVQGNIEKAS